MAKSKRLDGLNAYIEQQSKNSLKVCIAKDKSNMPITKSPKEPKFITMLEDSIPIEDSLGPKSSSSSRDVEFLAAKNLCFVEFKLVYMRGLNFAKSSNDVTPRIFSLKYLKLNQSGRISN